ncbi:MAG: FapA family protein [Spirochaetes bacterium]|nr:FapA family protein [Spirochaetota bacterium]
MPAKITLEQIQEYMRSQSEQDKSNRTIGVEAPSVPEALKKASIELGVPVRSLEYEVVQKGSTGLLGLGSKPWKLSVYEKSREVKAAVEAEETAAAGLAAAPPRPVDAPGEVFVRISANGGFLKATRPRGRAPRATEIMALEKLSLRGVSNFDQSLVARVVKHADGEYIRVADVRYSPANDAAVTLDITDGEMKALVMVSEPGPGGADLSADALRAFLQANGIVHEILEEALADFEDSPRYGKPVLVAEGTRARDGADARIEYSFSGEREAPVLREKDGRVDFKDISRIENVVAGQMLARKILAEPGTPGQTVGGTVIPATKGRDCELSIGKNVKLSEDGSCALAEINGQVLLLGGKINVEPVYLINGDVNLHTGNVLFLGTVIVKGSVEDGFSVKAAGNIEVYGSVGKCLLDAEGDIVVHQGIAAKIEGKIRAGRSLFAKFIEHARVEAGEYVVVTDGIIHSFVDSNRMILCQGKRAQIVGGRLRASEAINSKILGSVAGTETVLEVGYDPRSRERLAELEGAKSEIENSLEEVELNIKTLENLLRVQKKLPPEKAQFFTEQNEARSELLGRLEEITREMGTINAYIASLTNIGKISASERVYPGVRVSIKSATLAVRTEFKYVTFYLQGGDVKVTKYEAFDEELMRRK